MKKIKSRPILPIALCCLLAAAVFLPEVKKGVSDGLFLCASVLIPALFPVSVISLMLADSIRGSGRKASLVFVLSSIGGYPVGARLIERQRAENEMDEKTAVYLQLFCTNAGPGFIISAVGDGLFGSRTIGGVLFFSHILSSLTTALLFLKMRGGIKESVKSKKEGRPFFESFTEAVLLSCDMMLYVSGYVVLFGGVTRALGKTHLAFLCPFLEVTNGVRGGGIYFASFLLGFGGLSVIFQILSINKALKGKEILFFLSRIINGILSAAFTKAIVLIFDIKIKTLSARGGLIFSSPVFDIRLSFCLFVLLCFLFLSVNLKNNGGNLSEDLVR